MQVMSWMNNRKISAKLAFGFGTVLALTTINITYNWTSIEDTKEMFHGYWDSARASNEVGQVQGNLLSARLAMKDYLNTPNSDTAQLVADRLETTKSYIKKSIELVSDQEHKDLLHTIDEEIDVYYEGYSQTRKHIAENKKIVNDGLNVIGPQIESAFTEIMRTAYENGNVEGTYEAGNALRSYLMASVYTKTYLTDHTDASYDNAVSELKSLKKNSELMLDHLSIPSQRELARIAIELETKYAGLLGDLFTEVELRDGLINDTLEYIGPVIAQQTEDLKLTFKKQQDILGPKAEEQLVRTELVSLIFAGITLFFGVIAAMLISRVISNPIKSLTESMNSLAGGERNIHVEAQDHGDEIGVMARSVEMFREKLIENDTMQIEATEQAEERSRRADQVRTLSNEFDSSVTSIMSTVTGAVTDLGETATFMNSAANNSQSQSSTAAAAAHEATVNVETVAAAAEELSASISEITRQVSQSTNIAGQAVQESKDTNERIMTLQSAVNNISQVVDLITDIAEQTNLLTLNATIEAARAGEASKGFAVVASEVKSLASQTTNATEQIFSQIKEVQGSTEKAVGSIENISTRITEMSDISSGIAAAVEQQNAATQEIARNVQEAAVGTRSVSESVERVTETAVETGSASEKVHVLSTNLKDESGRLQNMVESFLDDVKAA
jgi:methyl-accepting chemotaxis protein